MKAISLWQPWASLIAIGAKHYETRSWETYYRGPLLICAAKKIIPPPWDPPEIGDALRGARIHCLPRGVALCVVNLIDCRPTYLFTADQIGQDAYFGDFGPGRFAWRLQMIRRIEPPFSVRGYQGLFDLPDMPDFEDGTA